MRLADAIARRRSIRRYVEGEISDETVGRLLEAACWAPSAHNRQPWRFAVLRGAAAKERLAEAMGARLRADRRRDGDDEAAIAADAGRSRARIVEAPLAVIVAMSLVDMDVYPPGPRAEAERAMAMQSTAMAIQNLLLAATAEGLGACWMCAPLFCPDAVREAAGLPADWEPQALLTIGRPANGGKPAHRRPVADFVRVVG